MYFVIGQQYGVWQERGLRHDPDHHGLFGGDGVAGAYLINSGALPAQLFLSIEESRASPPPGSMPSRITMLRNGGMAERTMQARGSQHLHGQEVRKAERLSRSTLAVRADDQSSAAAAVKTVAGGC